MRINRSILDFMMISILHKYSDVSEGREILIDGKQGSPSPASHSTKILGLFRFDKGSSVWCTDGWH